MSTKRGDAGGGRATHTRAVERERARNAGVSRVRGLVPGAQDGLLVPPGVVTVMAAANLARTAIVVAGLAAFYQAKFDDERRDVAEFSQRERVQLSVVLEREGLPRAEAERVAVGLAANPNVLLRTKAEKELGLSPEVGGAARGDGIDVGLPCVPTTIVPLWPYVVLGRGSALVLSVGCTLVAPFAIGVLKGRAARQAQVGDGLQVLLIGCLVAAVGFGIEHLAATLV